MTHTNNDNAVAQLTLIPELAIDDTCTPAPLRRSAKFTGAPNSQYAVVLLALHRCPLPRSQLERMAGKDVIENIRALGLELLCKTIPITAGNDGVMYVEVCSFTPTDMRKINRWLKKIGGANA